MTTGSELAATMDRSLGALLPLPALLEAAAADAALPEASQAALSRLGWAAVALPEAIGGLGLDVGSLAELFVVAGRRLLPIALRQEALVLAPLLAAVAARGDREAETWLAGLLSGGGRGGAGVDLLDPAIEPPERTGDGSATVSVRDVPVWLGPGARPLALLGGGWAVLLDARAPAVRLSPTRALDPGQGAALVSIIGDSVPVHRAFSRGPCAAWARTWQIGVLAEACGAAEVALEFAVAHARRREQFGRPLAGFQAIAHTLADMKADVEVARAGLARVVALIAADDPGADDAVAALAYGLPAAARTVCERAIQVHGGMGFTWEYGLHLYYRRVLQIQATLGGARHTALAVGRRYLQLRRVAGRRAGALYESPGHAPPGLPGREPGEGGR